MIWPLVLLKYVYVLPRFLFPSFSDAHSDNKKVILDVLYIYHFNDYLFSLLSLNCLETL